MDFYHNWLYEKVINTNWFLWIIVWTIFSVNIAGPVIYWRITSSKTKNESKEMEPIDRSRGD
jgi:hypothetical protein